jgi:hypothetical protein
MTNHPYPVVKVVFQCPENHRHVLGIVGRQIISVPGSPAGQESICDKGGLTIRADPSGTHVKLVGACAACHRHGSTRTPQLQWERVQRLLDVAENQPNGVLTVPFSI